MTESTLQEIVANLTGRDASQIGASTTLDSLFQGSLGRARLDAVLRSKTGVSSPEVYRIATYGELCAMLGLDPGKNAVGSSVPTQEATPVASQLALPPGTGEIAHIGIDMEQVAAFPVPLDYWEDAYYKNTFTPREIAYAITRPSPSATFAGIWCAKEAFRKAVPAVANADWTQIEVAHKEDGIPFIAFDGKTVAGALSISHSGESAVAVFVHARAQQQSYTPSPLPAPPAVAPPAVASSAGHNSGRILSVVALVVAAIALVLEFFHR